VYGEHGIAAAGKRPGRKGHPRSFYERIAARYTALLPEVRSPTRRIAAEEFVSVNTAAGWIRKARGLGLLPPAAKRN
jgi:hypothetical protein